MHALQALDRLRARRRVGSTRRRGNHMHDHSRFQRDINDVTSVSLSLSLYNYYKGAVKKNCTNSQKKRKGGRSRDASHCARSASDLEPGPLRREAPRRRRRFHCQTREEGLVGRRSITFKPRSYSSTELIERYAPTLSHITIPVSLSRAVAMVRCTSWSCCSWSCSSCRCRTWCDLNVVKLQDVGKPGELQVRYARLL